MKILYLVNHYVEYGGIEQMLDHKILALKNFDTAIELILVTRYQNGRDYIHKSHKLTKKHDLNCDVAVKGKKTYVHFYKKLKNILDLERPDVIVSTLTSYYAMILPFVNKKIPKVVEFHSTAATIKSGKWKLKQYFYNRYNAVVVLNEDEAEWYGLNNLEIIPNFIHVESKQEFPLFSERKKTIISAGRLVEVKQFDHLILAWKKLKVKFPNWKVEIYGAGSQYDYLKKVIANNGMSNVVTLMGKTNDLLNIMRKSSIYCLSSKTECFPMVLLEAKNAALPIISYNCPFGPKHIVNEEKDGVLVEMNNINLLAETLTLLIENDEKREKMSNKAFENAKEFDSLKIIGSWVDLFKKL